MDDKYETVKLCYTIQKYSSHSANYIPENIMVNNPSDQLSRWFTDSNTPSQFIMLKIKAPAIVETIKFGKYIKAHVSDLKKFQILGGTDEHNLSVLLSAGLKKDSAPEVFRLRNTTSEGLYLPVQYLKIVPLQSWGPAYNYTIWYVELQGKTHEDLMAKVLDTINLRKEEEAVRMLLKHLRRRRYKDAFEALSRESGVKLEGDLQARLWTALVENGDYRHCERILHEAATEGEFDWYMSWQPYTPQWREMSGCSAQVEARLCCGDPAPAPPRADDLSSADRDPRPREPEVNFNGETPDCEPACCSKPGPRGGHQLVVDSTTGTLYLFGGWNGTEDLDDLWAYDTNTERWTLLCRHSGQVDGPSPRSCHKMVFDPVHRRLYTLGRYLDNAQRVPANMNSDLYMYDVPSGQWSLVTGDTAAAGGPRLVFDHQMCIDSDTRTVYVFGGRVLPHNTEEAATPQYSGLYAYYLNTNTWQLLLADRHNLDAPQPRVSHSMLFHPVQRRLYIFAGQRNKEHLLDLWWWDVGTGTCGALCAGSACPPPAAGFTQRATLDPDTDEMFVLSGMSKEKDKRVYNTLWVFSLQRLTWACVYRNEQIAPKEPRPRFAHQLVYDPVRKIHYLFGGNPGNQNSLRLRLDDLWALQLERQSIEEVCREARLAVREMCYRELAATGRDCEALKYLRTELHDALNHKDAKEVERFQKLATLLFAGGFTSRGAVSLTPRRVRTLARRRALDVAPPDLSLALHAVLGAEDISFPSSAGACEALCAAPVDTWDVGAAPVDTWDVGAAPVDTWDVGEDAEDAGAGADWDARHARLRLFDALCQYFRPSLCPPQADISDFVAL